MKKTKRFLSLLSSALIFGSAELVLAAPTTTIDGLPLPTPTPRPTATPAGTPTPTTGTRGPTFTYSEPFTVTIENISVRSLGQLFSATNTQISRAQRAKCPRGSRIYAQSIELNGGAIGAPAANGNLPKLSGNARLTLVCQTRNRRTTSSSSQ